MQNIAILGATSHIAKGLISNFGNNKGYAIYLYARVPENVMQFIRDIEILQDNIYLHAIEEFGKKEYDIIINCIGVGSPEKVYSVGSDIFFLTEKFDNIVIDYIRQSTDCLYINFSSGAVYGTSFPSPINFETTASLSVNDIRQHDYYRIAKINSEAKHRSLSKYNILDLRVFSYFSRFIDLNTSFLMSDIVNSIINRFPFKTSPIDIQRDFVHPDDLFQLVDLCIKKKKINDVFDVYSKAPINKFKLLETMKSRFGLTWEIDEGMTASSPTGVKNIYYSQNNRAEDIGYRPRFTSLETITSEVKLMLAHSRELKI